MPPKAVHVIVQEVPMKNWGIGGKPCDELFKSVDNVKKYFQ
ncbi:MAG: 4-oxalocrotonate tautomerase family protein [Candidatus Hydrothermarchaeaceae archaeon]